MNERKDMPEAIPYIAYEGAIARCERIIKRLIIGVIIAVVLIVACNLAWLYAWTRYDYSSDTIAVDSEDGGNASYIGADGNIYNGEGSSKNQKEKVEEQKSFSRE